MNDVSFFENAQHIEFYIFYTVLTISISWFTCWTCFRNGLPWTKFLNEQLLSSNGSCPYGPPVPRYKRNLSNVFTIAWIIIFPGMGGMYGMGMGGTGGGMPLPTPHQASYHHQHYHRHNHHHHHHHHHNQHLTRPAATSPTSTIWVRTSTTWGPTSTTCPPPPSTTSRPSTTCQTHHWQLLLQCQPRWWLEQPRELNGPGVQKNVLQRARITPKHYFKISMIEKWRTTQRVIHVKFVTSV